jgi:hypothetical protein
MKELDYIELNLHKYYVDENGDIIYTLNFPYKFNRKTKYNTPNPDYINIDNWMEKLNSNLISMKLINTIPNIKYNFIEYESGDKELKIKVNIKDLQKYKFI